MVQVGGFVYIYIIHQNESFNHCAVSKSKPRYQKSTSNT